MGNDCRRRMIRLRRGKRDNKFECVLSARSYITAWTKPVNRHVNRQLSSCRDEPVHPLWPIRRTFSGYLHRIIETNMNMICGLRFRRSCVTQSTCKFQSCCPKKIFLFLPAPQSQQDAICHSHCTAANRSQRLDCYLHVLSSSSLSS